MHCDALRPQVRVHRRHHRSHDTYGWNAEEEVTIYKERLHALQLSGLLVWPPPKQIERVGWKDPDCVLLDLIARRLNGLRPATIPLQPQDIDSSSIIPDTVLKRSNSDCGHHVIFPDERRKRNVEHLRELSPYGEKWLMQEYVPTLRTVGEWRVFIVNGAVIQTVHTYMHSDTKRWEATLATTFWSLDEIK